MAKRFFIQDVLYPILYPLSRIYAFFARWNRKKYFRTKRNNDDSYFSRKAHICISIGNISWGGTGKTPITDWILSYLEEKKNIPHVILTRGYGAKPPYFPYMVTSESHASQCGDEPLMLYLDHQSSIIMVDPMRIRSLQFLKDNNIQYGCVLLDDGFQHIAVRRDINIVILDSEDIPFSPLPHHFPSNWNRVIPAGTWREEEDALADASLFLMKIHPEELKLIKSDLEKRISKFKKPLFPFYLKPIGLKAVTSSLQKKNFPIKDSSVIHGKYCVLSAIGNPQQALYTIETFMHRPATETFFFPDHCDFKRQIQQLSKIDLPIICTKKDAVKLMNIPLSVPCYFMEIKPVFYEKISFSNDSGIMKRCQTFPEYLDMFLFLKN